jgi:sugar phosphate isomerase/epimerase
MRHRLPTLGSRAPGASPASRRTFLGAACAAGAAALGVLPRLPEARADDAQRPHMPFKISLSQRSLQKEFAASRLDPLDFPRVASGFGVDAVEYVSTFYEAKLKNKRDLAELKRRAAAEGIWSKLIIVEGAAPLGAPEQKSRRRAVGEHEKWVEAAAYLGCHAVSVRATSRGNEDDQVKWLSDGVRSLCKLSEPYGIDILLENHDGFSANGTWLGEVLSAVGHPRCGSRPDFGNFKLDDGRQYDRYQGVRELSPFARAFSAKAYDFNDKGEETSINYAQMLKIVLDAGYRGHVAIEYEGSRLSEQTGIQRTQQLLERVRLRLASLAGSSGR